MVDEKVPVKLESLDFTNIFIAVFVILVTLVLFALYKRRKSSRNGILLTGLCDSGKTLIFSQLVYRKHIQTHTSIKENIGNFLVNSGNELKIVDVPGHERLRDKFVEQYKNIAKGIVFVVDSVTLQQDIRDAAEFLYNILTDPTVVSNAPKLLILCNKQDQALAKGSNIIRGIFEKELNTLRITKSSRLESVDPKSKQNVGLLGDLKGDFVFSSLQLKVDFAESYVLHKNGSVDIEQLVNWINAV